MYKFQTGDYYLTNTGDIFKITDVNKELLRMSVHTRCITIEYVYGTTEEALRGKSWCELHVNIQHFENCEAKCLGASDGVVQVLYGSNLKRSQANEETNRIVNPSHIRKRKRSTY